MNAKNRNDRALDGIKAGYQVVLQTRHGHRCKGTVVKATKIGFEVEFNNSSLNDCYGKSARTFSKVHGHVIGDRGSSLSVCIACNSVLGRRLITWEDLDQEEAEKEARIRKRHEHDEMVRKAISWVEAVSDEKLAELLDWMDINLGPLTGALHNQRTKEI